MAKTSLPLAEAYTLLEPGPVVLMTTYGSRGPNVMPLTWHTMMDFEPPLVGIVVSDRDYSFATLKKSGECTLNIPTAELAKQVAGCGNTTGRDVDKFKTFGLTPRAASRVGAPLIAECYASLECRVVDMDMVPRYEFFVLEVVKAWCDRSVKEPKTLHHRGNGVFMVAGRSIKLPSQKK